MRRSSARVGVTVPPGQHARCYWAYPLALLTRASEYPSRRTLAAPIKRRMPSSHGPLGRVLINRSWTRLAQSPLIPKQRAQKLTSENRRLGGQAEVLSALVGCRLSIRFRLGVR